MRIVSEKNLNQSQNKVKVIENQEKTAKNMDNNISIDKVETSKINKEEEEKE